MGYKMLSLLNFHPFLEEPGPNLERPELIVLKVNNAIDFGPKQNSSRLLQSCSNQEPETKLSVWLWPNEVQDSGEFKSNVGFYDKSRRCAKRFTMNTWPDFSNGTNSTPFVVHKGRVQVSQASIGFNLLPASISSPLKRR